MITTEQKQLIATLERKYEYAQSQGLNPVEVRLPAEQYKMLHDYYSNMMPENTRLSVSAIQSITIYDGKVLKLSKSECKQIEMVCKQTMTYDKII